MGLIDAMRGKNLRHEPMLNGPHQPQLPFSPEVASFIDHTTRQREELAYWKNLAEQNDRDLKVERDRNRMQEHELQYLRDDRDRIYRHNSSIMESLHNIKAIIVDAEERARAEAYAPPASGPPQQQPEETEQDRKIVAALAEKLAPEKE